jgi:hypothetical protein
MVVETFVEGLRLAGEMVPDPSFPWATLPESVRLPFEQPRIEHWPVTYTIGIWLWILGSPALFLSGDRRFGIRAPFGSTLWLAGFPTLAMLGWTTYCRFFWPQLTRRPGMPPHTRSSAGYTAPRTTCSGVTLPMSSRCSASSRHFSQCDAGTAMGMLSLDSGSSHSPLDYQLCTIDIAGGHDQRSENRGYLRSLGEHERTPAAGQSRGRTSRISGSGSVRRAACPRRSPRSRRRIRP